MSSLRSDPAFLETGTCWGHFTMFNLREQDTAAIDAICAEALGS
jgi:hypothetical protein